jgi:hypothetical protein
LRTESGELRVESEKMGRWALGRWEDGHWEDGKGDLEALKRRNGETLKR